MATTDRIRIRARATLGRRDLLLIAALLALVLLAPALARAQANSDTLNLWWTAPGDDGFVGTVNGYEVRYSTSEITPLNFGTATLVPPPTPLRAGQRQRVIVRGLSRSNVYWFAVRARDESGNVSSISNVLRWEWPLDQAPPATPASVTASVLGNGKSVRLSWPPSTEPDLSGYHVYRASARTGPWARLAPAGLKGASYVDDTVPDELDQPWYQVSAYDVLGNESARSTPIGVPRSELARQGLRWSIETAHPNPARVGETQHLPLTLPPGSSGAVVEILDGAGQRVRRFEVRASGPGVTEVEWDGRNESGRTCAPGLYRAWLIAGGTQQVVRLVRIP